MMGRRTADDVLTYLRAAGLARLELINSALELSPHFRYLVRAARDMGVDVAMRCVFPLLGQPGEEDLAGFLANHEVEVTGWLPGGSGSTTESRRGGGLSQDAIRAIKRLNQLGYGQRGSGLRLNLIHNFAGFSRRPPWIIREAEYRMHLWNRHGLIFNRLSAIANGPVQRLGTALISDAALEPCLERLKSSHCPEKLESVTCRSLMSVDWSGYVYDCEFNQMLGLPLSIAGKDRAHLSEFAGGDLSGQPVAVAAHCYGCTARGSANCDDG